MSTTNNTPKAPGDDDRLRIARESFSGRLLTDAQFDEAIAVTGIVEREILKSGAFKEKLGDYAYAFARTENFDATKAEIVLRDLFRARTGQSMNQMREALAEREDKLTPEQKALALDYASAVGPMIETGDKISFNRAFAHQAQSLAGELGVTDACAKRLMKEEFKAADGRDLYDWGKDVEERFFRPQIEAERKRHEQEDAGLARPRGDGEPEARSRTRSRSSETRESGQSASRPAQRPMRRQFGR